MNPRTSRFLRYQFPAIAWALCIFIASSLPGRVFSGWHLWQYDKLIHVLLYLVLGIFVYRALELFWSERKFSISRAFATVVLVTLYGGLDELHQKLVPGRTADLWDAASDFIGGVVSILLVIVVGALRKRAS